MSKKNVIITGASGNLGSACVTKFVSEKWQVIAARSAGNDAGRDDAAGIANFSANLSDEKQAGQFISQAIQKFSSIDAAILTVGGFDMGNIFSTTGEQVKKMISLNFETAFYTARPLFEQMCRQAKGHIIMIGSAPATNPVQGKDVVAYSLSKSLLFHLAELLNAEGKSRNVSASVVVPTIIDTPENRASMPNADFSNWTSPAKIADLMFGIVTGQFQGQTIFRT